MWCDALPALVLDQWRDARERLLNLRTHTAGAAVQAWLVDKQAQVLKLQPLGGQKHWAHVQ